jgi:hypothetical protein
MASSEQPKYRELIASVYKGQDGRKRVEQVVLRVLTLRLAESNRSLEVHDGSWFDAFAPAGIDDTNSSPTIVEVTRNLARAQSPCFAANLRRVADSKGAKSVLLIAAHSLKPERCRYRGMTRTCGT